MFVTSCILIFIHLFPFYLEGRGTGDTQGHVAMGGAGLFIDLLSKAKSRAGKPSPRQQLEARLRPLVVSRVPST